MKKIILLCFVLLLLSITGCTSKVQRLSLFDDNNKILVTDIESQLLEDKYIPITGKINGQKNSYLFDTESNKVIKRQEKGLVIKSEQYSISDAKDGKIRVFDNLSNEERFYIDFFDEGLIKSRQKVSFQKFWSNTYKYLYLYEWNSQKDVLIDIDKKTIVKLPVSISIRQIIWSKDDKKAILVDADKSRGNYIWDIESSGVEEIVINIDEILYWSPDSKHIYYLDTTAKDDRVGYKIARYNILKKVWEDLYFTDKNINEDSFTWLSEDEFIYAASDTSKKVEMAFLKPYDYFIVKVNVKNSSEKEYKLDAVLAKKFVWSKDYKYIYYLDERGLFKEKVIFNK